MANWTDIENNLFNVLRDDYYRQKHAVTSPRSYAHECVQRARGNALPSFSGEITVTEVRHPARPGFPTQFVRGFHSTSADTRFGRWWIAYELFERFRRATAMMPPMEREQKIKAFMRARSAVSHDWSNMQGIAELKLPVGDRTPVLVGKAHHQRLVTDAKHPEYVPNVFLMGGDLQFYICVHKPDWIRERSVAAA